MTRTVHLPAGLIAAALFAVLPAPALGAESKADKANRGQVTNLPRLRGQVPAPEKAAEPKKKAAPKDEDKAEKKSEDPDRDKKQATDSSKKPGSKAEKPAEGAGDAEAGKEKPDGVVRKPVEGQSAGGVPFILSADISNLKLIRSLAFEYRKSIRLRGLVRSAAAATIADQIRSGAVQAAIVGRAAGDLPEKDVAFTPAFHIDLFLIGPPGDPADIDGMVSLPEALNAIRRSKSMFLAAAPGGGIGRLEQRALLEIGVKAEAAGDWLRRPDAKIRTMRARLAETARLGAYTIIDRATWLTHTANRGKRRRLRILVRDDPRLQLAVGVLLPDGSRSATAAAIRLRDWLTSEDVAKRINRTLINGARPFLAEHGLRR